MSGSFLPATISTPECRDLVTETVQHHVATIRADIEQSQSLSGRLRNARLETIDLAYALAVFAGPGEALLKAVAAVGVPILKAAVSAFAPQVSGGNSVVLALDRAQWNVDNDPS